LTEGNKGNEELSPWFPSFASVHIRIEPGRRPALQTQKNETGWKRCPTLAFAGGAASNFSWLQFVTN
jgi:hypothetical protein